MEKYRLTYHEDGTQPKDGEVFVFGSNLAGIHGAGAAKVALDKYGARWGIGVGRHGSSYAIPTKRLESGSFPDKTASQLVTLPLQVVRDEIDVFIEYARQHPKDRFFVTRIGCGLAGYKDEDIAPYFILAPDNCSFAIEWQPYLEDIRV